jgi:aspartate/methionine/tyrosine aminotransferase
MTEVKRFPIAERIHVLRPTAVNRLLEEVRHYQATGRRVVSLMRGQPDSPTPPHIVAAAIESLGRGRTGYPDNQGEPAFRRAVAAKLEREQGLVYDADREVLITDGATCGLALAIGAVVQPGDEVLVPDPIYDAYASPIALFGGVAAPASSRIESGRFVLSRSALEAAISSRTRAILLNDPWNPVGTAFNADELQTVVDFANEHDLVLISDEIYEHLIYDNQQHISAATLYAARERTIVVNSLSKTYAMTGWRAGYCAAPARFIRAMLLLLQQFSRGPATFVQDAAVCALESSPECVRGMAAEYEARRNHVLDGLQGIPGINALVPDAGLFVMVDLRDCLARDGGAGPTSDDVRRFLLNEHGVVVIHGGAYGTGGEGFLRVSFAAGGPTLDDGLTRLRAGLLQVARGQWRPTVE